MNTDTVPSYGVDGIALTQRELALRRNGFQVISVESESGARFEIEMGRCGVLLMCFRIYPDRTRELAALFKKSCPNGIITLVVDEIPDSAPEGVDYVVSESAGPEAIVKALRSEDNAILKAS